MGVDPVYGSNGQYDQWQMAQNQAQKGAMMGGSYGGPVGAVVGGGMGLLHGAYAGMGVQSREQAAKNQMGSPDDQYRKMLMDYYAQAGGREAPQAGPAAQSGYSSFRGNQTDLVSRLEALSKGQGPSLAAQQFQQSQDRNMAGQQSMAQSGRGGPLAALNAANNMGQLGAQGAQGSAMARIQEQQMALNQLGLTLHGARGADEANNQFNANEQNQMAGTNLDAKLRTMGYNDQARLQILSQMGQLGDRQANNNKPSMFEKFMAGASGMSSFMKTNNASNTGGGTAPKADMPMLDSGATYYQNYQNKYPGA